MLKRLARTFGYILLFVAGFATYVAAIALFSSSYQACVSKEHAYQATQKEKGTFSEIGVVIRCEALPLDAHAGALSAIGTFAVAFFTLTLWIVTDRAVRLARDEFISTHRPKISVRGFQWDVDDSPTNTYGARFIYLNKGETTATVTEIGSKLVWSARDTPNIIDQMMAGATVPPRFRGVSSFDAQKIMVKLAGGQEEIGRTTDKFTFNGLMLTAAEGETADVYCVGYIAYTDDKGRRRKTGFCRRWNTETGRWENHKDDEYEYAY